jgi:hypothetical protein
VTPKRSAQINATISESVSPTQRNLNLKRAVAGLKTAHLLKITLAFEFSVLTLTVPGLRSEKFKNPACF